MPSKVKGKLGHQGASGYLRKLAKKNSKDVVLLGYTLVEELVVRLGVRSKCLLAFKQWGSQIGIPCVKDIDDIHMHAS